MKPPNNKLSFLELIRPGSGKSSTRYAGLVSLYALIVMAALVLFISLFVEIPRNNADLLQSISYTLGVVIVGAFTKMGFEKKENKVEPTEKLE